MVVIEMSVVMCHSVGVEYMDQRLFLTTQCADIIHPLLPQCQVGNVRQCVNSTVESKFDILIDHSFYSFCPYLSSLWICAS